MIGKYAKEFSILQGYIRFQNFAEWVLEITKR